MNRTGKLVGGGRCPVTYRRRAAVGSLRSAVALATAVLAAFFGLVATGAVAGASSTLASVTGQGSTYAALAFQTWTQGAQVDDGLNVNYTSTGSPAGLSSYAVGTATFAGTEAEYTELYPNTPGANTKVPRGFAYTPDVAGAVAVMYHVALNSTGSDPVTYLHLSPLTVARIFMGIITTWTSPTISKDNKGLVLPHEQIKLDLRSGQSGTTALFYDWVKHSDPSQYATWVGANGFPPPNERVWEVDDGTSPGGFGHGGSQYNDLGGSDQQAEAIAAGTGLWSIGYDEFGYAFVYHDDVAWIENASGNWTQPYAKNIAAALKSAVLAPTTSQTLAGVYASTTPTAYPMSAYSYILYQCATTPTRPTCKGQYSSQGVINTMSKFMRYIACTGQVKMATIGYSPLPADLSQFLANAIGYMTNSAPETLTASDCDNPQFKGNLGVGATPPPDPTVGKTSLGSGPGGGGSSSSSSGGGSGASNASSSSAASSTSGSSVSSGGSASQGSGTGHAASGTSAAGTHGATTTTAAGVAAAVGSTKAGTQAVGGGTTSITPDPVVYRGPATVGPSPPWPWLVVVLLLLIPVAWVTVSLSRRRRTTQASGSDGTSSGTSSVPPLGDVDKN
jgi:phosphate transport system substrate-binding protein